MSYTMDETSAHVVVKGTKRRYGTTICGKFRRLDLHSKKTHRRIAKLNFVARVCGTMSPRREVARVRLQRPSHVKAR